MNHLKLVPAVLLSAVSAVHAADEPHYMVMAQHDIFEVRQYAPYIVAEVQVPGPVNEAGNQGFRILADYIFGNNKGAPNVDRHAAVLTVPTPVKIEMTAPVMQTAFDTGFKVQFVMPSEFNLDTLPAPGDSRIKLCAYPAQTVAVIRYSGSWSDKNYADHLQQLRHAAAQVGVLTKGEPVFARYDAPFVPSFFRRNEIWLTVQPIGDRLSETL